MADRIATKVTKPDVHAISPGNETHRGVGAAVREVRHRGGNVRLAIEVDVADRGDFRGITKRINGGVNGLADRTAYWERAKVALEVT